MFPLQQLIKLHPDAFMTPIHDYDKGKKERIVQEALKKYLSENQAYCKL